MSYSREERENGRLKGQAMLSLPLARENDTIERERDGDELEKESALRRCRTSISGILYCTKLNTTHDS